MIRPAPRLWLRSPRAASRSRRRDRSEPTRTCFASRTPPTSRCDGPTGRPGDPSDTRRRRFTAVETGARRAAEARDLRPRRLMAADARCGRTAASPSAVSAHGRCARNRCPRGRPRSLRDRRARDRRLAGREAARASQHRGHDLLPDLGVPALPALHRPSGGRPGRPTHPTTPSGGSSDLSGLLGGPDGSGARPRAHRHRPRPVVRHVRPSAHHGARGPVAAAPRSTAGWLKRGAWWWRPPSIWCFRCTRYLVAALHLPAGRPALGAVELLVLGVFGRVRGARVPGAHPAPDWIGGTRAQLRLLVRTRDGHGGASWGSPPPSAHRLSCGPWGAGRRRCGWRQSPCTSRCASGCRRDRSSSTGATRVVAHLELRGDRGAPAAAGRVRRPRREGCRGGCWHIR